MKINKTQEFTLNEKEARAIQIFIGRTSHGDRKQFIDEKTEEIILNIHDTLYTELGSLKANEK